MAEPTILAINCEAWVIPDSGAEVEMGDLSEVTLTADWAEGEASTRGTRVKQSEPTQLTLECSGKVKARVPTSGTSDYVTLRAKHAAGASIKVALYDGPKTQQGVFAWRSEWKVFGMGGSQGLTEVLFKDFTLKPCAGAVTEWGVVDETGAVVTWTPL